MGVRSWWGAWRRPAEPVGRHSTGLRATPPPPFVPGAAASLVAQSATAHLLDAVAAAGPAPAHVTLGFSDGGSVVLADDDPRVRTFRAAAAAIVEPRSAPVP